MEIELRVILLVVGLVILFIVGMDLYKRRLAKQTVSPRMPADPVIDQIASFAAQEDLYNTTATETETISEELLDASTFQASYEIDLPADLPSRPQHEDPAAEEARAPSIISITIMSRDQYGFMGSTLLHAIKNANLYFGKGDIFHRHENENGSGNVLFSLVAAVEPGYFFLDTLPQEHVPGVTLFLLPELVVSPNIAFDKLVRTAKQMAFALNGELFDQERQPLTTATIDKYRLKAKRR